MKRNYHHLPFLFAPAPIFSQEEGRKDAGQKMLVRKEREKWFGPTAGQNESPQPTQERGRDSGVARKATKRLFGDRNLPFYFFFESPNWQGKSELFLLLLPPQSMSPPSSPLLLIRQPKARLMLWPKLKFFFSLGWEIASSSFFVIVVPFSSPSFSLWPWNFSNYCTYTHTSPIAALPGWFRQLEKEKKERSRIYDFTAQALILSHGISKELLLFFFSPVFFLSFFLSFFTKNEKYASGTEVLNLWVAT